MAVFQISKIQLRRGKKNTGSGLPQLASGELAWAIDSQELFIGNGAVGEGAPAVGNTKIITEHDNILDIIGEYQYDKNNTLIQTGVDENHPISNTIQSVLDRTVSSQNFGAIGDGNADDTIAIQRAIDQLFLNAATINEIDSRVELILPAGTYKITSTIYLPSYTFLSGAGIQKTIFNFTGTGTAFEYINDSSSIGMPSIISSTTYNNQPKYSRLRDFTISTLNNNVHGIKLNAVRDSLFENIEVVSTWEAADGVQALGTGLGLYALSSVVTTQRNIFKRIIVKDSCYGIFAKQDINSNVFDDCTFANLYTGVSFGVGANGSAAGEQYGPRKNSITNSSFDTINRHGIIINLGTGNKTRSNSFVNIGNDLGGAINGLYSIIKFTTQGNTSSQDSFDRATSLASNNFTYPYFAEVEGSVYFSNTENQIVTLTQANSPLQCFRLPISKTTSYSVSYIYQSTAYSHMRKGTLNIAIDFGNSAVMLADDFEFVGPDYLDENLMFSAAIVNESIVVYYANSNVNDIATLTYTYSALS